MQRVAAMITRYQSGVVGEIPPAEHDLEPYRQAMRELQFDRAIDEIWVSVRALNQYIEDVKPWAIAKQRDENPDAEPHLAEVLSHAVGTLMEVADMLTPFMPSTSQAIRDTFGSGVVPSEIKPLFPKRYIHTPDPRAASAAEASK